MPLHRVPTVARPLIVNGVTYRQVIRNGVATPLPIEVASIAIRPGETFVVTGPNGVGKSAMLGELAQSLGYGDTVETFFGGRHVQFQDEEVDTLGQGLKSVMSQLNGQTVRYRQALGDQHLKSVIRRLLDTNSQTNQDIVDEAKRTNDINAALIDKVRPLEEINTIFGRARLQVQFLTRVGRLFARRGEAEFGVDRLSDGERSALLIAAAVLVRPKGSFIVIDEPERHLNPAISGPFLAALKDARPDVGYIFSTHDLKLLDWLKPDQIVHLRSSDIIDENPERRRYDFSFIPPDDTLPEALRAAVLGSRDRVLLVEGEASSDDQTLYGLLYPDWHVVAKGGNDEVRSSVAALRNNHSYHWLKSAGLIDRDGRSEEEAASLLADGVRLLPVPTIECLFLEPVVLAELAEAKHANVGGLDRDALLAAATRRLSEILPREREAIIARRIAWEANRLAVAEKLSFRQILDGATSIPAVDLGPVRTRVEAEFEALIADGITLQVVQHMAVKNTGIPNAIATALGYAGFPELKQAIIHHLRSGTDRGKIMGARLSEVMPGID